MFSISTYAYNIHKDDLEYVNKNIELSIINRDKNWIPVNKDFTIMECFNFENNEGYFEGSIVMVFNNQTIIDKEVPTSDLYDLWNDLINSLLNETYLIEYLDVPVSIFTKRIRENIILTVENNNHKKIYTIPFEEYSTALIQEFINFFNHLNHNLKRNKIDSPYYFELEKKYDLFN